MKEEHDLTTFITRLEDAQISADKVVFNKKHVMVRVPLRTDSTPEERQNEANAILAKISTNSGVRRLPTT